jgi:hypothetical protein
MNEGRIERMTAPKRAFCARLAAALIGCAAPMAMAAPALAANPVLPALPAGAPACAQAAAAEANHLLSEVMDEGIRAQEALKAKDLVRAKDSKDRQETAATQLANLKKQASTDPSLLAAKAVASSAAEQATDPTNQTGAQVDAATSNSGCDGASWICLFGGALVGSYTLTEGGGDRSGQTGHHIVNLLVPAGGLRFAVRANISIDLGLYTAIISPEFQPNGISTAGSGCSNPGNKFNDMLPCEGNTALRPYGALLLGGTVGTSNSSLGIVTAGFTAGVARTTQDANAFFFYGLMIGTGGIYTTVSLSKPSPPKVSP